MTTSVWDNWWAGSAFAMTDPLSAPYLSTDGTALTVAGEVPTDAESAAQLVADSVDRYFTPTGCATVDREGSALTYVLSDCSGPLVPASIDGMLKASFAMDGDAIDFVVASSALEIDGVPAELDVNGSYRAAGNLRTVEYSSMSALTGFDDGVSAEFEGTVTWAAGSNCIMSDGSGQLTTPDGRSWDATLAGFARCAHACPSAGVATLSDEGESIMLTFDGGDDATLLHSGVGLPRASPWTATRPARARTARLVVVALRGAYPLRKTSALMATWTGRVRQWLFLDAGPIVRAGRARPLCALGCAAARAELEPRAASRRLRRARLRAVLAILYAAVFHHGRPARALVALTLAAARDRAQHAALCCTRCWSGCPRREHAARFPLALLCFAVLLGSGRHRVGAADAALVPPDAARAHDHRQRRQPPRGQRTRCACSALGARADGHGRPGQSPRQRHRCARRGGVLPARGR